MAEENRKEQDEKAAPEQTEEESSQPETLADAESEQVAEVGSSDDLQAQIDALQQELTDAKDQALRTAAEAQNIRRRAEIDADNARKFAVERFAKDLLPVVDNLERALENAPQDHADDAVKAVLEGVELTYRSFADMLEKHNLKAINPEGEPFDPQLHEAMSMVEAPGAEPNSVIQVVQKGYTLNERLLRAAMVVVSK
ncbi:nucleotide exchange factor GrpE [Litorivivens sp.]|uniref:nucleotide exchange factor GrpE n=1 Tax=Litorivivens sp. TaxID=2020868 RepID=UPI003568DE09